LHVGFLLPRGSGFGSKWGVVAKLISSRFQFELELLERGVTRIAGVDEAGRGPLAGPVFAAAVSFPAEWILKGLPKALEKVHDSKQLTARERDLLYAQLTGGGEVGFGIAQVEAPLIDQINILQATHRAMNLALAQLNPPPQHVLVDGLRVNSMRLPHTAIVGGDALSYSIGAASILAKVSRDRLMVELDGRYPGYGFAAHKGYGTAAHRAAIKRLGACPIHRQSFSPFGAVQAEMFD
jgi:ribonuclease HII